MESKQLRLFVKRMGFNTLIATILNLDNYLT